ncbi:uncharacterized protein LOC107043051 [Diachasma alloeum]|uniref:uncharacterized protein LOC107043051 n=1 Tax=Diachasma alloeum TaxID=454923 RepID=UPI00073810EC|nr:uncharacterized protein LOC107043051 [Diachasma alloeum]
MEWDGKYWNGVLLEEVDDEGELNYPDWKSDLSIEQLPTECILEIFSYLSVPEKFILEDVCPRWKEISENGWPEVKRLFIRSTCPRFTAAEIEIIFRRCGRFLKSLRIDLEDERTNCLHLIQKHCRNVREFEIDFVQVNWRPIMCLYYADYFSKVYETCRDLRSITILSVKSTFTDAYVMNLRYEIVESIHLTVGAHNVHFSLNLSRFRNLRCLNLERFIIDENRLSGFDQLQNLKELYFSFCNVHISHIKKIKRFKKLEKLWMNGTISEIRDNHISTIVHHCRRLKILNVDGLRGLTDRCFIDISKLPILEELHMMNLSRVSDYAIANMQTLKTLSCPQCPGIGNDGLKRLIQCAPNLHFLSARRTSVTKNFLADANEAIQSRQSNVELFLDLGPEAYTWQLPANFSPLLILEGSVK